MSRKTMTVVTCNVCGDEYFGPMIKDFLVKEFPLKDKTVDLCGACQNDIIIRSLNATANVEKLTNQRRKNKAQP